MEEKGKDVSVTQEFKNVSVSFACLIREEKLFFFTYTCLISNLSEMMVL